MNSNTSDHKRRTILAMRSWKERCERAASAGHAVSEKLNELQRKLEELKAAYPEWTEHNARAMAGFLFIVVLPIATYFLDVLICGPTAEVLAERAFYGVASMVWVNRMMIPMAIVLLEIAISLKIYFAIRDAEIYHVVHKSLYLWYTVGILFALVMPSLVVSTILVQQSFESSSVQNALLWQLFGLVALTLAMHIMIIFGGHLAHEAKSFFTFKAKRASYVRGIKRSNRKHGRHARSFSASFDVFRTLLNEYRQEHQDNYCPGPFDAITRKFATIIYGYDVTQLLASTAATYSPPVGRPDQANPILAAGRAYDGDGDRDARRRD